MLTEHYCKTLFSFQRDVRPQKMSTNHKLPTATALLRIDGCPVVVIVTVALELQKILKRCRHGVHIKADKQTTPFYLFSYIHIHNDHSFIIKTTASSNYCYSVYHGQIHYVRISSIFKVVKYYSLICSNDLNSWIIITIFPDWRFCEDRKILLDKNKGWMWH